jgi:hypothetical protein
MNDTMFRELPRSGKKLRHYHMILKVLLGKCRVTTLMTT